MKLAILTDIHANREAFEACLADAERRGAQRLAILGDIVGYGADPNWAAARAMELAQAGAIVIKGNHDEAAVSERGGMTADAAAAAAWTRGVLEPQAKTFLDALPLEAEEDDRLFVHADGAAPAKWHYIRDAEDARASMDATRSRVTFCGHVHVPALYGLTAAAKLVSFRPVAEIPVPLMRPRHWLAVLGAVGQPRDGDPAAAYAIYDTASSDLTTVRVPYDVAAAAGKIRSAGLPDRLASRLFQGR